MVVRKPNLSKALKGNQNGVKLKDPAVRQLAYKQYCAWLALGKSWLSFTFVHEFLMCTGETIESYIKLYPDEFPPIQKEIAFKQGYAKWEEITEDSAIGKNKDANTASLQMVMRNKFKWDKKTDEEKDGQTNCSDLQENYANGAIKQSD